MQGAIRASVPLNVNRSPATKLQVAEIAPGWLYVCRNALEQQVIEWAEVERLKIQSAARRQNTKKLAKVEIARGRF